MDIREAEILRGAQQFDLDCLAEIYDRFSPGLHAYAVRLTGDSLLAEDCVSETFSRLLKALKAGKGPKEHLQAYLYRVAHNWITDLYRREPPPALPLEEGFQAEEGSNPDSQVVQRLEQQRVRSALRLLTDEQRQVVLLRFIEGWENEEVAAALQKPVGAVKALQHRALNSLRRLLLPKEGEIFDGTQSENGS